MKSGENWSSFFREDIYRLQYFIHVYSLKDKILIVLKGFATLIKHCKFQPLVVDKF